MAFFHIGQFKEALTPENWSKMQATLANVSNTAHIASLIVAEENNHIIGSIAYYAPGKSKPKIFPVEWSSIRLLAVTPAHQRKGIGKLLVQECIQRDLKKMKPILPGAPWLIAHKSMLGVNQPHKITLNGRDYVLWKNTTGEVFALDNVCPHMQAPLSQGWVCAERDTITCPFHAMEFDGQGRLYQQKTPITSFSSLRARSSGICSEVFISIVFLMVCRF